MVAHRLPEVERRLLKVERHLTAVEDLSVQRVQNGEAMQGIYIDVGQSCSEVEEKRSDPAASSRLERGRKGEKYRKTGALLLRLGLQKPLPILDNGFFGL